METLISVSTDDLMSDYLSVELIKEGRTVPRKGHIAKRDVLPDPIYKNKVVTKLINNIMLDGKKGVAQKIVYGAFDRVAEETGKDALEVFTEAMNNIMPALEVKSRRIGGATYQVPIDVRPDRRQALALRWITLYSRKRGERADGAGRGRSARRSPRSSRRRWAHPRPPPPRWWTPECRSPRPRRRP